MLTYMIATAYIVGDDRLQKWWNYYTREMQHSSMVFNINEVSHTEINMRMIYWYVSAMELEAGWAYLKSHQKKHP